LEVVAPSEKKVDTDAPVTTAQQRKHLAKETKESKDKLFFVLRQRPGHQKNSWHLIPVDREETDWNKAKQGGVYHVRFYVRCLKDSKKVKVRECAFWPEIHEFKRDGVTMGPIVPTKPSKVEHLLMNKPFRYMWYQDTINLFDSLLVGPFDSFGTSCLHRQWYRMSMLALSTGLSRWINLMRRIVTKVVQAPVT
jgi:hypothetical protein